MTSNHRIKVKIGDAEFEAEGSESSVQAQYESFLQAVRATPAAASTKKPGESPPETAPIDEIAARLFEQRDNGLITLKALPVGEDREAEAMLLLLWGYKQLRAENNVYATRLVEASAISGLGKPRFNDIHERVSQWVLRAGNKKGTNYQLNNQGVKRAIEIANGLL
jgi:hypothetical protein